jgi:hypothetical protein
MQPYFFPYIGYFQLIRSADLTLLYPHVNYIKAGWVNRNRILIRNGSPQYITVPVVNSSPNRLIRDVVINASVPWRTKMLKSILHDYRSAPYFEQTYDFLDNALSASLHNLSQLNISSTRAVAELLGIGAKVSEAGPEYLLFEEEFSREYPSSDSLIDRRTQRVLKLCEHENASTFVNPSGGRALYDKTIFKQQGIDLLFLDSVPRPYPQRSEGFHPNLSIIDVLFNCGVEGTRELLESYQLS